ncbi:hypothetical protein Alches_23110 [Alicyclobacillus hesperidum subsp. aegles]|uniref:hypothetical protein n=1 Tax=Alicyclobacillus hesperidum TaxID=89784 RepID=UPI00222D981A|nr:hypothetical protein [Alicyclobacillus hesperidum]GLG02270.1 hypothetical protein Alches_23110 [Alicyclobacillus hesperidum subsp. aegles]
MRANTRKPRRDSDKCVIVNRTVSFNLSDPYQAALFQYTDAWINFSGAAKRLIAAEMERGKGDNSSRAVDVAVQQPLDSQPVADDVWESASSLL